MLCQEVDQVESRIRAINSAALVRRSQFSQVLRSIIIAFLPLCR